MSIYHSRKCGFDWGTAQDIKGEILPTLYAYSKNGYVPSSHTTCQRLTNIPKDIGQLRGLAKLDLSTIIENSEGDWTQVKSKTKSKPLPKSRYQRRR
jgi:hypothetical protein